MTDERWSRFASEGILGRWHMPAGEGVGYVLTACDLQLRDIASERVVQMIPANERCPVCQGVLRARQAAQTSERRAMGAAPTWGGRA